MKKLSYLTDSKRNDEEFELIISTVFYTILISLGINIGYNITKKIQRKMKNKNTENKYTAIVLSNGNRNIVRDIESDEYADEKYKIVEIDDCDWVVYVYGEDRTEYAYFLSSNMYFNEDNKIIFDINNATDEKYEDFTQDKSININQRVRRN